jgi:hypothetical protein
MSLVNTQRILCIRNIPLTGANTDFQVAVPLNSNTVRYKIISAEAVALGVSAGAATIGLFTAAAGGGTTLITNVALSGLTGVGLIQSLALAAGALNNVVTASPLFWRVGSAGLNSVDLYITLSELG